MIHIQNISLPDNWIYFIIQCLIHLAFKTLYNVVSEKHGAHIYMEAETSFQNPL
jgi:hypothetical protein